MPKPEQKEKKIADLAALYYSIISNEHHKDRDCHFVIETRWSYGELPTYSAYHFGYISEFDEEYDTYDNAVDGMILNIKELIEDQKKWAKRVLSDSKKWEQYQVVQAQRILELLTPNQQICQI